MERAVSLAEGTTILSKHITIEDKETSGKAKEIKDLKSYLEEQEKKVIINALSYFKGDKKKVMEVLNISKTTLYEKLKKYDIK